jgi:PPOX class probable F420-dependent enzyme
VSSHRPWSEVASIDPASARRRLAEARVARLATVGPSGPHLVPVCFALADDTAYSAVDDKPKRHRSLARLANLAGDRRACLLVDHYEENWNRLWWVRADVWARLELGRSEQRRALELLLAKYPQYAGWELGPLVALDVERITGWQAGPD